MLKIRHFQEGTTHLVWSFGKGPLYELEGLDLTDPDSSSANGKRSGHSSQPISIRRHFTNKKNLTSQTHKTDFHLINANGRKWTLDGCL